MSSERTQAWQDGIVTGLKVLGTVVTLAIGIFVAMVAVGLWMGPLLAVLLWRGEM